MPTGYRIEILIKLLKDHPLPQLLKSFFFFLSYLHAKVYKPQDKDSDQLALKITFAWYLGWS